ncbi:hypothetical protein A5670_28545 [Mycolicibacterium fortuitum]|nr:hypothetical protein A5670_28545 [Mycolicibacterium fortuitum]
MLRSVEPGGEQTAERDVQSADRDAVLDQPRIVDHRGQRIEIEIGAVEEGVDHAGRDPECVGQGCRGITGLERVRNCDGTVEECHPRADQRAGEADEDPAQR